MTSYQSFPPTRFKTVVSVTASAAMLLATFVLGRLHAQEVLFQETFETDGNGTRYTVEGGAVYELDRIVSELGNADQQGPIYWARNQDISFVGVPAPTPEKRAIMAWHHTIVADDVSEDFLKFFDGIVNWMTGGKSKATILFTPAPAGDGDFILIDRLEAKGHTVLEDDESSDLPDASTIDAVIKSSSGGSNPSRFALYEVPLLSYRSTDHDDMLISSIGTTVTTELGTVSLHDTGHPISQGLPTSGQFVSNANQFDLIGDIIPGGSTVVASFKQVTPSSVDDIEEALEVIQGNIPSKKSTGTVSEADLTASGNPASGVFGGDFAAPGNPTGALVTVATGKVKVDSAGLISIGMGADDGGYLRIDLDRNGISDADKVVSLDGTGAFRYATVDVDFPAGTFDFEWMAYNAGGGFGSELITAFTAGGGTPSTVDDWEWEPISPISNTLTLVGNINVTTYAVTAPPEEKVVPFLVAIESPEDGGSVFGGGAFGGYEGEAFFAGSALNKFEPSVATKSITWNQPINVAGKDHLKLTVAVAATFLDFETSDFLNFYIDEGNSPLISFSAPSGNDKFFNDQATNGNEPTRLDLNFRDVTYDIPSGLSELRLRVESVTTWWNEIVGFDNIRITSGEFQQVIPEVSIRRDGENLVIEWTGTLQSAVDIRGPWQDVADDSQSPIVLGPGDQLPIQFGRSIAP